jgi:hypothetical protein
MKQEHITPLLFVNLNILNILDKFITYISLQNPKLSEANPIVQRFIEVFGLSTAMIIYMLFGAMLLSIFYFIVTLPQFQGRNISNEIVFIMFNGIFYTIVINNIYQSLTVGMKL